MEDDLSALDRSWSDQLKPSPEHCDTLLDTLLEDSAVLARLEGKPRPATDGEEGKFVEFLPLPIPDPVLTSLSAFAPKLILRANGEPGEVFGAASPSSTAFSSIEPEPLLEILSPRALAFPNMDGRVGEPESPKVEIDMRRRC